MARLITCGFELNTPATSVEPNITGLAGAPTSSTTTVHGGTYSLRISSLSSGFGKINNFTHTAGNGPFFYRVYLRIATAPGVNNRIIMIQNGSNTQRAWVQLNTTRTLTFADTVGTIGTTASALALNQWYRIEIAVDLTGGAGAHALTLFVDGVSVVSSTTRTLAGTVGGINVGGNGNSEANTAGDWFFDDLAANDSTGSFQNTLPGDGKILHLVPNAAGDNAGWTRGGVDSGANWSQVDDIPPNDDTDRVQNGTLNVTDDYNITASGLTAETISVVHVGVRCAAGTAFTTCASFVCRIKASSGGTVEEGTDITDNQNTTSYDTNNRNTPNRPYTLTLYDLPGASTTAWTPTDLDNAQIGLRVSVADADVIKVTSLWLVVEYVPAVPVGQPLIKRIASIPFLGGSLRSRNF